MTEGLAGKRILIVEDEYFIASDLKRLLERHGAVAIGPVGTLDEALPLAEERIDVAVLDVNLQETLSYAIADRLMQRGVPYMFLTGYDDWSLPEAYRDAPCLAKPSLPQRLVAALETLMAGQAG